MNAIYGLESNADDCEKLDFGSTLLVYGSQWSLCFLYLWISSWITFFAFSALTRDRVSDVIEINERNRSNMLREKNYGSSEIYLPAILTF